MSDLLRCHHMALCVRDIEEAKPFYTEVLGLDEIPRPPEIADKFKSAWFQLGTSELHVVEDRWFQPLDSPKGPHIAIATTDFEATIARIEESDTKLSFGPGRGPDGLLRAIVRDPTGNVFEILDPDA